MSDLLQRIDRLYELDAEPLMFAVGASALLIECRTQIESLTSENTRLRALLQVVAEEDLDADAADGVTVLQVVIKEARDLLAIKEKIE